MWKCKCGHSNSDLVRWCENCDAKNPNEGQRLQAQQKADAQKKAQETYRQHQQKQEDAAKREQERRRLLAEEERRQREKEAAVLLKIQAEEEERRRKEQENTDAFLKENGHEGFYEYQVVSIGDGNSGSVDIHDLANRLNRLGRDGWHLKCAYTNELGHNTTPGTAFVAGSNATIDQNILIFERFIKFK